jgi:predicted AlkP superfamily pyrophosphatase or phosphodiesterase
VSAALSTGLFAQPPARPKLVLAIAVDQFRYDYLTRFRADYTGGFKTLYTQGAFFTNARYEHVPTVTAIGHSTFLSGATPSMSGIIGNEWFDRETGKKVTSVVDSSVKLLGGSENPTGSSPRRLLVSTLGDEMKIADARTKVIGVSLKDRSAILPAGHMADGAFWFDNVSGNFVSSTYYFPDLPAWVQDFNNKHWANQYAGKQWNNRTFVPAGPKLYASLPASPWGNELIEAFSEAAIDAEHLGHGPQTDLLAVSFSSNDYVGHELGPDDPAVRDMADRTDKLLAKLFAYLDQRVGMRNVVVVLTADHGVSPVPDVNQKRRMPGGVLPDMNTVAQQALTARYGEGKWILSSIEYGIYLDWKLIEQKKLNRREVIEAATEAVRSQPHIFAAYTYDALLHGEVPRDFVGERVANGFYAPRAADVFYLPEPYWLPYVAPSPTSKSKTTHGTPFGYDAHVPVVFMGPGIKPGIYNQSIRPNDIAPTLATLLSVETPSGSVGRALSEILK